MLQFFFQLLLAAAFDCGTSKFALFESDPTCSKFGLDNGFQCKFDPVECRTCDPRKTEFKFSTIAICIRGQRWKFTMILPCGPIACGRRLERAENALGNVENTLPEGTVVEMRRETVDAPADISYCALGQYYTASTTGSISQSHEAVYDVHDLYNWQECADICLRDSMCASHQVIGGRFAFGGYLERFTCLLFDRVVQAQPGNDAILCTAFKKMRRRTDESALALTDESAITDERRRPVITNNRQEELSREYPNYCVNYWGTNLLGCGTGTGISRNRPACCWNWSAWKCRNCPVP